MNDGEYNGSEIDRVVDAVRKTSKYRHVCEDLIRNIGARELSGQGKYREALKSTKSKLHQVCGAYFVKRPDYGRWLIELKEAKQIGGERAFKGKCAEIMGFHYSTRERLTLLDSFYSRIFSLLPPVRSVLDVACGFNPLSIPWMPSSGALTYHACDVYHDMVDFLNEYMDIISVEGETKVRDVAQYPPEIQADLALVLLTIPCLEQVDRSAGTRLLESLNARHLAVSFPVRTIGGREKDMRRFYSGRFHSMVEGRGWETSRLDFDTELVFLIHR